MGKEAFEALPGGVLALGVPLDELEEGEIREVDDAGVGTGTVATEGGRQGGPAGRQDGDGAALTAFGVSARSHDVLSEQVYVEYFKQ